MRDNDESIIPDEREIARVQEHIEEVRPVTARVTVIAPVERKCDTASILRLILLRTGQGWKQRKVISSA